MGMDVSRFEFIRALSVEEIHDYLKDEDSNLKVRCIEMNERLQDWMEKNNISYECVLKTEDFDWDAWFEKNPQYKDYNFTEYDLREEVNPKWLQLEAPDGSTILIDDGFIYKDVEFIYVEVKEIGYVRKPFRHSETPSRVEGDTLVLTVTNFSDKGEKGYEELKKIDAKQVEEGSIFIFNVNELERMKEYSYDNKLFYDNFIKNWKPNHFVWFNW